MDAFKAETYLRLLGERLLLDRDQQHRRRSPLDLPASALVFAGLIDSDRAARVIDDHTSALGVRSGERGFPHFGPPKRRRARGNLEPRETIVLDREIAFADGLLLFRDMAITAGGATLRFRWRSDAAGRSGVKSRTFGSGGQMFPWGATAPVIEDDDGNRPTVTSGGGGGSDSQWEGKLELHGALSPTTAWLQIEGTRIELDRRIAPSTTWVEPIAEQGTIERFLWRCLAVAEMPFGQTVDLAPAIEALKAAGVLTGEEALLSELEAVSTQMPGRHGQPRGVPPSNAGSAIPESWRSLLSRSGRNDGPTWTIVLGVLSAPFDGIQVAIHSISSNQYGFEAEFEVSPNVLHSHALDELPVVWWGRDDRGNRHLGHPDGWSGSQESASGSMRFWPPLDPRATELQIVVSADQHQVVFAVPVTPAP
jgi:hypothetical protein